MWFRVAVFSALASAYPAMGIAGDNSAQNPVAVGRAGTDLVSGDSGTTAFRNPAGLARREELRVMLGTLVQTPSLALNVAGASSSPTISLDKKPTLAPLIAAAGSLGPWVVGLSVQQSANASHVLPRVTADDDPADVAQQFPHRYGGEKTHFREHMVTLGASVRATETVAVGLSASILQRRLTEERMIWGGTSADVLLDPTHDQRVATRGKDSFIPAITVGALAAPYSWPFEFAIAGTATAGANLRGNSSTETPFDADTQSSGRGTRELPPQWQLRAGARYLATWFGAEVNVEWHRHWNTPSTRWNVANLVARNSRGDTAEINSIDGLYLDGNKATIRAATDWQLVPDFLWVTAGYRWQRTRVEDSEVTGSYSPANGHGVALGIEASIMGTTIAAGALRSLEQSQTLSAEQSRRVLAPFATIDEPAAAGNFERSHTTIALSIETAWQ